MKISEFIEENTSIIGVAKTINPVTTAADSDEYNDEVGMVKSNIHTIVRVMTHLCRELKDDENIPEWCQEKIASAKGMLVNVMDYIISQHEQGIQPTVSENASAGATAAGAVASAPTAGKNAGTLFGGSYQQPNSPVKRKSTKKESVIKR